MISIWHLSRQELLTHWKVATDVQWSAQSHSETAEMRVKNRGRQPLKADFIEGFTIRDLTALPTKQSKVTAAIIRDSVDTNGEREMAYALYLAGFDEGCGH